MKVLFAAIALIASLGASPQPVESSCQHGQHQEAGYVYLARATQYRAVCSKGDLNATYANRTDAVRAAQDHQQRTGHQTSVRKE
jgi:hypothetical protein